MCFLGTVMLAVLGACNAPPLYHTRAQEFLKARGVSDETISKLVEHRPLSGDEVAQLSSFDDVPTLHLLGTNPGTPVAILERLATHNDEEVRWGAATNPNTPLDLVLRLRTPGKYSTMNSYVARNPGLPARVIGEMYQSGETSVTSIAMNPSCPVDIMWDIARNGEELDRTWLAWNRNLPPDLLAHLAKDPSTNVLRMLAANPAYRKWIRDRSPVGAPSPPAASR